MFVDLVVEQAQVGHDVTVEELVDDEPDLDLEIQCLHRSIEGLTDHARPDRDVVDGQSRPVEDGLIAAFDGIEFARETVTRLVDHARQGQGGLEVRLVDETEFVGQRQARRVGRVRPLAGVVLGQEVVDMTAMLFVESALDIAPCDAQGPHGIEIGVLSLVALGLVGEREQRVVGIVEHVPEQTLQELAGKGMDMGQDRPRRGRPVFDIELDDLVH